MSFMITRSILIAATSAVLTAALIGVAAPAQFIRNHNSKAPVSINAGSLDLQSRQDRVVASGNVIVTQAGLTITAARVTGAYTDSGGIDIKRIDATGGVTITKDDLRASSSAAIYDLDTDLITLIGNVKLKQGANNLNGGRLVIDLNTGRSSINNGGSGTTQGSNGGRVTGTFTVPQRKN